jgi:hypothetical protein
MKKIKNIGLILNELKKNHIHGYQKEQYLALFAEDEAEPIKKGSALRKR